MASNHVGYNQQELDYEEDEEDYDNLNHPPPTTTSINPSHQDAAAHHHVVVDEEDDDVDADDNDVDDSTSSSPFAAGGHLSLQHLSLPPPLRHHHHHRPYVSAGAGVTISLPADHSNRISGVTVAATPISFAIMEEKKPAPIDESRRLFQRLWTDEDEIELLGGYLEYILSRGMINSSHHHDTAAFYDQVKSKFQLEFNKNQLVEKLRRLKKKFRTITSKISSGNEYAFKTPHEQTTFEISRKIWGGFPGGCATAVRGGAGGAGGAGVVAEEAGFDDEDGNPPDYTLPLINQSPNLNPIPSLNGFDINNFEKKTAASSRKRSRAGLVKLEEKQLAYSNVPVRKLHLSPMMHNIQNVAGMDAVPVSMFSPFATSIARMRTETGLPSVGLEKPPHVASEANVTPGAGAGSGSGTGTETGSGSVAVENPSPTETKTSCTKSVVEEIVKNCLSPILKELLHTTMNMNMNGQMGGGPQGNGQMGCSRGNVLGFAFSPMPLGLNGEMLVADEKWKKQQILEFEVYLKRLELMQDQIKEQLDKLKSVHS